MIDTTSMYFTICGLLFLIGANISDCQSSEDHHQQCSRRPTSFGIHSSSGDYDSLECSSLPSSLPTDYEIWVAIKKSLNDWHLNQKSISTNSIDNNQRRLSRTKREQLLSLQGVEDDSQQSQMPQQQVCYEHFGCFRHKGPFDYLNTLPASPESIETTFSLHTRRNPIEGEPLDYNDNDDIDNDKDSSTDNNSKQIHNSFNGTNSVKIIIHGFGSSSKRPWVQKMTEVLLQLDDFNIINVDWQNGSKLPNYVQAAANTQLVGKQIARLIRKIERLYNVPPSRFHLIGFSLGAHVAGFAGQEVANISRITGLDPASPLFEGYPANVRLDPSDAQFVDVIHSNGDGFIRGGLGVYEPMGSVDFYPNGGRVQVGCSTALGALTNILYHGQWNLLCNHRRAFRFFIDSVHQDCTFRAFSCTSYEDYIRGQCFYCGPDGRQCSNMGYFANLSQGRGPMYLITRDKEPFCVNQFKVQIQFTGEQGVTWGQIELQLINADGMNETFTLTQEVDQLKESERIQSLIVAHPKLTNVSEVTLTYTKYRGWIYYGLNEWHIDRIELLDSNFVVKTYCRQRITLSNTVPVRLKLFPTNCTVNFNGDNHQQGIFPNRKNNEITVLESQKQKPARTDTQWPPNIINTHPSVRPSIYASYMTRPTNAEQPLTTAISNPSSLHPMHVSYDYDMASASGPLLNTDQNGQFPPLFELLPRHAYARDRLNKLESTLDDEKSDSDETSESPQQLQTSSIISPILNGASRMFWKFWNNLNQPPSTIAIPANHSSYGTPQSHHSHRMVSSSTSSIRTASSSPIFILSPVSGEVRDPFQKPDRKLANSIEENMNDDQKNIDLENNNQDDDHDESIGSNEKTFLTSGKHYVLYSIIPISSTNNEEQRGTSMGPIRHTTTTIMMQPIHLINTYQVIPNNNNNNNMMISTTMMTPTVSSLKNRNILSPSLPPSE